MAKPATRTNPGMMFVYAFFTVLLVNAGVIALAHLLFPTFVVLGTMTIPYLWAVLLPSSVIALGTVLALPVITQVELTQKRDLTPPEMMAVYFVLNAAMIWGLSRFSEIFGMGVSSWVVVIALAAVLDTIQGAVMMMLESRRNA